jgi:hypothetical protein
VQLGPLQVVKRKKKKKKVKSTYLLGKEKLG